jgi:hypothetical protein
MGCLPVATYLPSANLQNNLTQTGGAVAVGSDRLGITAAATDGGGLLLTYPR